MFSGDLSGPVNGLIILSSVSLGITQFFYTDIKSRYLEALSRTAEARTRSEKLLAKYPQVNNEGFRKRYDNIKSTKIRTVRHEMSCLFFVLFACGVLKIFDTGDLYFHNDYTLYHYSIIALLLLTAACAILLGWTAISLKLIGIKVRELEATVERWCAQVEVVESLE